MQIQMYALLGKEKPGIGSLGGGQAYDSSAVGVL
jgi:hypothetical protein